ncbi:acyl-CoA carboxylase subunit epsilon [Nonomuraea endophytica]|uniref:acyl-CoA carboxylase subunit epsilon n=1 Tax=Nonomuraea endophytica TaxID=714136 RepID=UPI001613B9CA|nr:acyl-CoA carboxylase subunit epsilon [Nonomuraea endophytica]
MGTSRCDGYRSVARTPITTHERSESEQHSDGYRSLARTPITTHERSESEQHSDGYRSLARTPITTHERSESKQHSEGSRRLRGHPSQPRAKLVKQHCDGSAAELAKERKSTVTAHLKVVRGDATPEEIAALVTVLTTRQPEPTQTPGRKPETWRNPARAMRRRLVPGKSAWRLSALP